MGFIEELGSLALGSRIKNLSDSLLKDMTKVYKEQNVDFEPRWFTFFQLLLINDEITVTQIARELNQSHPAVVQVVNVLEKKKLVITKKDNIDNRKRLIKLSNKGKRLAEKLAPLWELVQAVANEILNESTPDLLSKISAVEKTLQHKSTYQRIIEKIRERTIDEIEFVKYDEKYLKDFQQLNEDWLNYYLELSDHDIKILSDPYNEIIKNEGNIFFLISENKVIGTYALQRLNAKVCELSKFTIKKEFRGWKLGALMMDHAIEIAKNLKYESIVLLTHSKLKEATKLYRKTGFEVIKKHPDLTDETGRCSIYMQLILSNYKPTNLNHENF
ncbi:MAG: bifunctional helix-turn-helix transcriptional regulator/GNAT family N-acetyltransferase [Bacteroidales bacterium]|nr:bifunctional helix-turn-helix transcriptional regulator/GNAT family N-acetyltransferase [Bacteroidales bacterium]